MLVDFHHFLHFSFSLLYTLKFLIHYFQFVNSMPLFSLPIHPQEALKNWSIQCKPIALPTKCPIELLVLYMLKNAVDIFLHWRLFADTLNQSIFGLALVNSKAGQGNLQAVYSLKFRTRRWQLMLFVP